MPQIKGEPSDTVESGVTGSGTRGFVVDGWLWLVLLAAAVGFAL